MRTSYGAALDDAKDRMKRGERQKFCFECDFTWVWDDQCNHEGKLTERELKKLNADIERQVLRERIAHDRARLRAKTRANE